VLYRGGRIVRRRCDFMKVDAAVFFVEKREIRERAADVDAYAKHDRLLGLDAGFLDNLAPFRGLGANT